MLPVAKSLRPGGERHSHEKGEGIAGEDREPALPPPWAVETSRLSIGGSVHSSCLSRARATARGARGTVAAGPRQTRVVPDHRAETGNDRSRAHERRISNE